MKSLISILAGLVAGMPVVMTIEMLGHQIFPPPEGMDFSDRAAVAALVETLPFGAFLFVLLAWTLGALVASALAARISHKARPAYIATAVFLGLCGFNFYLIPHPVWMIIATLIFIPGAGLLGARLFARS